MTYIEFYGLPGVGKTTFSSLINKSMNKDSKWKYNPITIIKTIYSYSRFLGLVLRKYLSDFNFFKDVMINPIHFTAFLKGMLVRFIVAFSHEKSGFFVSDHGLIQTLSQNNAFREVLLKDKIFSLKIMNLFPKKATYVYLKLNIPKSLKRTFKRERTQRFSYEFLLECRDLFEYSRKHMDSRTIIATGSKTAVIKNINSLLDKVRREND